MTPATARYLKPRDVLKLILVLVVLFLLLIPIYESLSRQKKKEICTSNLKEIYTALTTYVSLHEDRYPEVCFLTPEGAPILNQEQIPFTWASQIFPYMNPRSSFRCPAADPEENTLTQHPTKSKQALEMSYGMYVARSSASVSSLTNPGRLVLISETAKGARAYNPTCIELFPQKKCLLQDGFLIGYDNSNWKPNEKSRFVTRLAFRNTSKGHFSLDSQGRHEGGNLFLLANGQVILLPATAAKIERKGTEITGAWALK